MLLRILTAFAFSAFLFIIANMAFQTKMGYFFTHSISQIPFGDKSLHFLLLMLFTLLLNASLQRSQVNLMGINLLTGSLIVASGITLEECSQAFIPARNFELMDMLCNYAGIFAGSFLPAWRKRKHSTDVDQIDRETISFQTICHRTRPLHHESGHGRRAARRMG